MDQESGRESNKWRPGTFRGKHVAIRGRGANRNRRVLNVETAAQAERAIKNLNDEVVTGGQSTVKALLDLHEFHKGEKWNRHDTRNKARIVDYFGEMHFEEISPDLCEDYVEKRTEDGMSFNTIRLELSHLRTAIRHAKKKKRINTLPEFYVPSSNAVRERWLNEKEFQALITGACEFHVKIYCILALATAARPSHILKLQWQENVDMDGRVIDFRGIAASANKRAPRIPMNNTAFETLTLARATARTGNVIEFRGKAIANIKKGIQRAAERAGLDGVSPYVLRHTAGVWMAKAGVSMEKIAEYMGHSNLETTRKHYAHFHPEFMKDASSALEIVPDTPVQLVPDGMNKNRTP